MKNLPYIAALEIKAKMDHMTPLLHMCAGEGRGEEAALAWREKKSLSLGQSSGSFKPLHTDLWTLYL